MIPSVVLSSAWVLWVCPDPFVVHQINRTGLFLGKERHYRTSFLQQASHMVGPGPAVQRGSNGQESSLPPHTLLQALPDPAIGWGLSLELGRQVRRALLRSGE